MIITPYQVAQQFIGIKEVAGAIHNPMIIAMLQLDNSWPDTDEVPWCSAYVNFICKCLNLPRSKSLSAKSWLKIGVPVLPSDASVNADIVILNRGSSSLSGHVGFFSGIIDNHIYILGGNQNNQVCVSEFNLNSLAGIRRLIHD